MIPILYDYSEKDFVTNGRGRLSDCISCIVTEERNGIYECEFEYPVTGEHFSEITEGMIIACTHDDTGDIQPFDIYAHSTPINGVVTFYAHHVSYRLSNTVVMPYTENSCVGALLAIPENVAGGSSEFTYWTNKGTGGDYENKVPTIVRGLLGGQENSILDVYGTGDYEFDKFMVRLHTNRGVDSGVQIRYGKNLVDLTDEISEESSYNAVVPYWLSADGELVTLDEKLLIYNGAIYKTTYLTDHELVILRTETNEPLEVRYRVINAKPLDMSDAFEEAPTQEQLRTAAASRFENTSAWLPNHNLTVDFVQLWQTEEYKDFAPLQRVRLCDTVSVYHPVLGISAKEKVVKTTYNVLLDRYDSIELGNLQTTLAQSIKGDVESTLLEEVPKRSELEGMFDLIRGGLGGYVYLKPNAAGKPEEILIMDQPEINDAVNIIRMNKNGIGFSQNGYNGPFNSAWTIDGTFYADWIKAGVISDVRGKNSWDMDTGYLVTQILRATEYIYMNGTTNSYFKIPFWSDQSEHTGYMELSSNGFLIQIDNSKVKGKTVTKSGSGEGIPGPVTIGFLSCTYEDGGYNWGTDIMPDLVDIYKSSGSTITARTQLGVGDVYIADENNDYSAHFNATGSSSTNPECLLKFPKTIVYGDFYVQNGTKSRIAETKNYDDRALYCYETPTPLFGDIGEAQLDEEGICYVDIDDIFSETIASRAEYQVFLQKEGEGDCWIADKQSRYFVIQGTPDLKVAWELKAKQKDYENYRLEQTELDLDEYVFSPDTEIDSYIREQEELLYG